MEQVVLKVDGMTCTACEQRIGSAVEGLAGVRHVAADHERGAVRVEIETDGASRSDVRAAIEQAG